MLGLRPPELIIIVLILLLLFGAKRLPDTARALGQSLKIFKRSVRDEEDDRAAPTVVEQPQITAASQPTQPVQPVQPASADETKRVQP